MILRCITGDMRRMSLDRAIHVPSKGPCMSRALVKPDTFLPESLSGDSLDGYKTNCLGSHLRKQRLYLDCCCTTMWKPSLDFTSTETDVSTEVIALRR